MKPSTELSVSAIETVGERKYVSIPPYMTSKGNEEILKK